MSAGLLETLGQDCAARLLADSYFTNVPVHAEDLGVLESEIDLAIDSIGACVVVLSPHEEPRDGDAPGPQSTIIVTVRVIENPLFNRDPDAGTGKRWSSIGDRAKSLLHHFAVGVQTLTYDGFFPGPTGRDDAAVARDYRFKMLTGLTPIPKVARPSITGAAAAVQIVCATEESLIFYTTDGSYPRPGNAAATLFGDTFAVAPGTTVRAAAFTGEMQSSDVPEKTFT